MRKQNGITLVALAITIIVLLILAGVTIQILLSDSGIIKSTTKAKEESEYAVEKELVATATMAAQIEGEGTITTDNLNNELQKNFNNDNVAEEVPVGWIYKAKKSYTIYQDGKVEDGEYYLPGEYKLCQYIEGKGYQYIDLGFNSKEHPNIIVEIEGSYISSKSQQYIFGAGSSNSWILMGQTNALGIIGQMGKATTEQTIINYDTEKHLFKLDTIANQAIVDSTIVNMDANGLNTFEYNYLIFAINNKGNIMCNASFKMYSCKITENGKYILNLIPCLDENDVPCMYDSVSKQCFYNNGTGTFGYGQ